MNVSLFHSAAFEHAAWYYRYSLAGIETPAPAATKALYADMYACLPNSDSHSWAIERLAKICLYRM